MSSHKIIALITLSSNIITNNTLAVSCEARCSLTSFVNGRALPATAKVLLYYNILRDIISDNAPAPAKEFFLPGGIPPADNARVDCSQKSLRD